MPKIDINRTAFFQNIGVYISLINTFLSKTNNLERLGNHIKIVGGFAFKSKDYINNGVPVIRISDFKDEKIQLSKVKYYKESEKLEKYELYEGDIIIAMTGGTIGKLAIVQPKLGKLYLNQRVGKFQVINKEELDKEYVYWIARGIQDKLQNIGYGGAQPNISNSQIEKLKFPFPDKKNQNKIINFLNDLKNNIIKPDEYFDSETEKEIHKIQRVKIKTLELDYNIETQLISLSNLRHSILQDAVNGKLTQEWREKNPILETAKELLKKIKDAKKQLIEKKKINKEKTLPIITKDEIPFEIPESWEWCRMQEIGLFDRGKSKHRPRNDLRLFTSEKGYPFIQTGDVSKAKYNGGLIISHKKNYSDFGLAQSKLWKKNTLCITIAANIAETGFLDYDACFPDSIVGFTSLTNFYTSKFVQYFIDITKSDLERYAPSTAQKNINLGILYLLKFPFPPLNEQKKIVEIVNQLLAHCDILEQEIKDNKDNSEKLMQSVLNELIGEENNFLEKKQTFKKVLKKPSREIKYNSKTILMDLVKLLKVNGKLHAEDLWKMSKYPNDIDAFYAELKKQIEEEKAIKEVDNEKGYLELV